MNPHRFDPYKNFKFRVKIGGRIVAGVAGIRGLARARRKLRGLQKYPNVTLKRGLTRDAGFKKWATAGFKGRKGVVIETFVAAGRLTQSYKVRRGWVSKYEASDLKAGANDVGIESLTLEHEGVDVVKPRRRSGG